MANLGHAAGLFDKMKITGGAEKWIHGEGHHVGLKIDLDPSIPIGWLENMANLFGFSIGEEDAGNGNHHYDLSFDRRYGVGGNKLYTPHKYLTEMSMAEMYPSSSSGGAKNLSYASNKEGAKARSDEKRSLISSVNDSAEFSTLLSDTRLEDKFIIQLKYLDKIEQYKKKADSTSGDERAYYQKLADTQKVVMDAKLREVDEKHYEQLLQTKLEGLEKEASNLANTWYSVVMGYTDIMDKTLRKAWKPVIGLNSLYNYERNIPDKFDLSTFVPKYGLEYFSTYNKKYTDSNGKVVKYDYQTQVAEIVKNLAKSATEEETIGYTKQFDTIRKAIDSMYTSFDKVIKAFISKSEAYFDHQVALIKGNKFITTGQQEAITNKLNAEKAKADIAIQKSAVKQYQDRMDYLLAQIKKDKVEHYINDTRKNELDNKRNVKDKNNIYDKGKLSDSEYEEFRKLVARNSIIESEVSDYDKEFLNLENNIVPVLKESIELNKQLSYTPTLLEQVGIQAKQSLEDGLLTFLTDGVNEAKSLEKAFSNLIISMLKDLQKLFAKKLINDFFNTTIMKKWFPNTDRALEPERMSRKETFNYVSSSSPYTNYGTRASNNMLYGVDFSKKESVNAGLAKANTFAQYAPKPTQTQQIENGIKDGYKFNNKLEFSRIYKGIDGAGKNIDNLAKSAETSGVALDINSKAIGKSNTAVTAQTVAQETAKDSANRGAIATDNYIDKVNTNSSATVNNTNAKIQDTNATKGSVQIKQMSASSSSGGAGALGLAGGSSIGTANGYFPMGITGNTFGKSSGIGSKLGAGLTKLLTPLTKLINTVMAEVNSFLNAGVFKNLLGTVNSFLGTAGAQLFGAGFALKTMFTGDTKEKLLSMIFLELELIYQNLLNIVAAIYGSKAASGGAALVATGGHITGEGTETSDSIPAMLSNNEYVVKASSVRKYGTNFLNAVNNGTFSNLHVAKFATGGKVGGTAAESTARGMETFGKQIGNNASFTGNYNLILATNQEEATKAFMESPAGQRVLLRFNQNQAGIIHRMGNY